MSTRRVVLLVCDTCGEVFDHGNRTVTRALAEAKREGWERKPHWLNQHGYEWRDKCGVCLGKYIRTPMGYLVVPNE